MPHCPEKALREMQDACATKKLRKQKEGLGRFLGHPFFLCHLFPGTFLWPQTNSFLNLNALDRLFWGEGGANQEEEEGGRRREERGGRKKEQ